MLVGDGMLIFFFLRIYGRHGLYRPRLQLKNNIYISHTYQRTHVIFIDYGGNKFLRPRGEEKCILN
jgi:hypothetical protein